MPKAQPSTTLQYYEENASEFTASTFDVDFAAVQDAFLELVPKGGYILDFGCGSGRDTKYFLEHGYKVDATDGSEKLCKIASANTGIQVRHMLFEELNSESCYDGIWACASILHLDKLRLQETFTKMAAALKPDGVIYTSFKCSEFEGERRGRYFTDFTEESFRSWIKPTEALTIEKTWLNGDVRAGRSEEQWLNIILRKTAIN